MGPEGSISHWVRQLREGAAAAVQPLWERYFPRLVELARKKLRESPRRGTEEDVALSAFDSFCRNAVDGRFPQLDDRDDLWRLLVLLTARKVARHLRDERRQKRGGGAVPVELTPDDGLGLDQILSREPTPEFAAQAAEECQRLLHLLGEPVLKTLALWKMEGYSVEEIAQKLGCVSRSIKRKLRVIRGLWEKEIGP